MMEYACLDGEVMPASEARIPATDDGLLRGDGAFEVLRLYAGRAYAVDEHLVRLQRSAENLRMPVDVEAVSEDMDAILEAAGARDGLLRLVVTRGGHRLVLTEPMPALPDIIRLGLVTYTPTRVLDGIKSLSYAANMLATRLAQERGFDEALLVTPHGRILEAPTSSFFWVRDGRLLTPPLDEHILSSITRAKVLEEYETEERPCTREDLEAADEAFLASTVREVMPVGRVEDIELATGGPVSEEAGSRVRARIDAELAAAT